MVKHNCGVNKITYSVAIHVGSTGILWLTVKTADNIRERKTSELIVELRGQSDEDKLKDKDKKSREPVEPLQVCGV